MLSKKDFVQLAALIDKRFDDKLDEKLDERFRNLPSKDQFFTGMDSIMGELKAIREEQTLVSGRMNDQEETCEKISSRVTRLEKSAKLPSSID